MNQNARIQNFTIIWTGMCISAFLGLSTFADEQANPPHLKHVVTLAPRTDAKFDRPPVVLKGSIEHSESLPPVPLSMRPGALYDRSKLPKPSPTNKWFQIPKWFAGSWRTEDTTCYYSYNYKSSKLDSSRELLTSIGMDELGWQQDRQGGIWEYQNAPYIAEVDGGDHIEIQYIRSADPVTVSSSEVVIKFRSTNIRVDKSTGRVFHVAQTESFQTYQPYRGEYVKIDASIKEFDAYGKPSKLQKDVAASVRTAPFTPVDSLRGMDMKAEFQEYLLSHKLESLVP